MVDPKNIAKAVSLVDQIVNLVNAERQVLKKRIKEAAQGDEQALTCVIFFPRDHYIFDRRNLAVFREILFLILRGQYEQNDDSSKNPFYNKVNFPEAMFADWMDKYNYNLFYFGCLSIIGY